MGLPFVTKNPPQFARTLAFYQGKVLLPDELAGLCPLGVVCLLGTNGSLEQICPFPCSSNLGMRIRLKFLYSTWVPVSMLITVPLKILVDGAYVGF
jgi:hypothetical protein